MKKFLREGSRGIFRSIPRQLVPGLSLHPKRPVVPHLRTPQRRFPFLALRHRRRTVTSFRWQQAHPIPSHRAWAVTVSSPAEFSLTLPSSVSAYSALSWCQQPANSLSLGKCHHYLLTGSDPPKICSSPFADFPRQSFSLPRHFVTPPPPLPHNFL